ncbi:MAG TPA: MarR family winged helix-turn-helix transcriptional regulator [Gaiellaceae bacterium]|nr:MarR family winged helix-turn-helix transcriptional regulator [Gaiellaceae bacterium]
MAPRAPDPTAILDELGRLLRQLTRLSGGADDKAPPMTATQRIALVELGADGPLRVNDLAHRMGTSAATASRAVDVLETLGLVVRAPDTTDRRALSIELTRSGRRLLDERLRRAADAFEPAIVALSAAERRTLLVLLERMTGALRHGPDRRD